MKGSGEGGGWGITWGFSLEWGRTGREGVGGHSSRAFDAHAHLSRGAYIYREGSMPEINVPWCLGDENPVGFYLE